MGVKEEEGGYTASAQLQVQSNHQRITTDRDVKIPYTGVNDGRVPGQVRRPGNNRFGNKGTPKCFDCRRLKRACVFGNDPSRPCDHCIKKNYACGVKMRSNEQVQITIPGQKDIKQPPPVQEEASWSQEDDFLPRFFEFTRACRMTDDDAAFKLYWEVCAYLEQNPRSLIPAPMVQPEQSNSFPPAPQAQFGLPEELMPPQPTYLDPNLLFTTPRSTPTPRVTNTYSAFGASGYYPQPESLQGPGGSNNQMPGLPSGPSLQINVSSTVSQNSVIDVDQSNYDNGFWANNPRPTFADESVYFQTHSSTPSFNVLRTSGFR